MTLRLLARPPDAMALEAPLKNKTGEMTGLMKIEKKKRKRLKHLREMTVDYSDNITGFLIFSQNPVCRIPLWVYCVK